MHVYKYVIMLFSVQMSISLVFRLHAAYCYTCCGMVCPCICLSKTLVSLAKMAESIDMRFGLWTRVGLSNHVLVTDPDPPKGSGNFGVGKGPAHREV